jgi:thiamine biosynthesis lipoprotein
MKRRTFIAASLGLCTAAGSPAEARMVTGATLAFGTTVSIAVVHPDRQAAERAIAAALCAALAVDRLMNLYSPRSEVARLNRDGILRRPSRQLLAVLGEARRLSLLTGGAFDITVQPLWQAFSAAAAGPGQAGLPDERDRLHAARQVDWRHVVFDAAMVRLMRPGMAITLNGLAQGYAADLALQTLREHGIAAALLDTGEFIARGRKPAAGAAGIWHPWTLGVRDPRDAGALDAIVRLDERAMATSGDYASTFTPDCVHHHIFDPATGFSPLDLASVTVMAPSGLQADGLSTAFMVLGAARAHALAARLPGVDLLTIDKRGLARRSPGFAAAESPLT